MLRRDPVGGGRRPGGRFVAKEATIKVLRPTGHQPDWRCIEIRRDPAGFCDVHLSGGAARMARAQGISNLAVSLTHEAGMAAAVVVAVCEQDAVGQRDAVGQQDAVREEGAVGDEDKER